MQWLYETERTTNRPFDGIKIGVEKYGTPIYITKEERNLVAETDIPAMFENWMMKIRRHVQTSFKDIGNSA